MDTPRYTKVVGEKFYRNGDARHFPGNTVISRIPPSLPVFAGLVEAQQRFKAADKAGKYAFLPASSLHMTVIEGLCDQVRIPEKWSNKLDLQLPLPEVNRFLFECMARVHHPAAFTMRVSSRIVPQWLAVVLEPADTETLHVLQKFRDRVSRETGIRFPNHDTYTYHITLAYNLLELSEEEDHLICEVQRDVQKALSVQYPIIALGAPKFTRFEDMLQFDDME